jgi:hypothetical protein
VCSSDLYAGINNFAAHDMTMGAGNVIQLIYDGTYWSVPVPPPWSFTAP